MKLHSLLKTLRGCLFAGAIALAVSSCSIGAPTKFGGQESSVSPEPTGSNVDPAGSNNGETIADYATIDAQVLQKKCTYCHGSDGGVNLQTYANVYNNRNRIRSVVVSGSMPRGNSLTTEEFNTLIKWIDAGAPESRAAADTATAGVMMNEDGTLAIIPHTKI